MHPLATAMESAWTEMAGRFGAYELVVPGSTAFQCLMAACPKHCCNRYTVNLSDHDVARVVRYSGLSPRNFLECEDGEPIALPLAQPFVLGRAEGTCVFLGPDMACQQYSGRPNACRLYPHFALFVDGDTGSPTYGDTPSIARSLGAWLSGRKDVLVPILMRHLDCPGFVGEARLRESEWLLILRETARIQYAPESSDDWPMGAPAPTVTVD